MNRKILLPSIILLTLFALQTFAAKLDLTSRFDFDTTVKIQDNMPERLQPYLIDFITIGNWQIMSVLVFLTMLLQPKRFWLIGLLYLSIVAIEIVGKNELQHPPPPQFMTLRFQNLNLPPHYVREAASFPSGHAARAAYLSFLWIPLIGPFMLKYFKQITQKADQKIEINLPFGFKLSKEQNTTYSHINIFLLLCGFTFFIFSLLFTFLIGFIKVYLGEHWISDVLGGWLLGSGLALATFVLSPFVSRLTSPEKTRIY